MNCWIRPYIDDPADNPQAIKFLLFRSGWLFFSLLFWVACAPLPLVIETTPESTGLPVAPEFEAFYQRLGGREILGEPITMSFELDESGPLIQYFQAARLEYDFAPGLAETQRLQLFPLGEWALAGLNEQLAWPEPDPGPARYFAETGRSVEGAFLAFYEASHGERWLGPPISPQLDRDGLRVQYFRNGRLDWHPELPVDQRIRAGFLGQAHFDAEMRFVYPRALSQQFVAATSVIAVDVFATVRYPILYAGDQQILYVTILTPDGRSVSGSDVKVEIDDGESVRHRDVTVGGGQNMIQVPLATGDWEPGQTIELQISVLSSRGDLLGQDRLAYRIWW